jgi:tetratricopeptide (TPR) repeat protein
MLRGSGPAFLAVCLLAVVSCSSAPPRSDTVTDVKQQAAAAAVSGEAYFRQGRYELALQFFSEALSGYTSVDNMEGVIRCTISVGQIYLATDRIDEAAGMFTRARERARGLSTALFIDSSVSLGELYLRKGDHAQALEIFQEALVTPGSAAGAAGTSAKASPGGGLTPEQTGVLYHNIGAAYKAGGDLAKALEALNTSLRIDLDHKLTWEAAADYYMIASVYSKMEDYPAATRNAQAALDLDKKIENSPGIGQDLHAMGLIAGKQGDKAASYDYFQRSYLVFSTLGMKNDMKKLLSELAETAEGLGMSAEAERYRQMLAQTSAQ